MKAKKIFIQYYQLDLNRRLQLYRFIKRNKDKRKDYYPLHRFVKEKPAAVISGNFLVGYGILLE